VEKGGKYKLPEEEVEEGRTGRVLQSPEEVGEVEE